ncbi:MAG: hypothetical protein M1830_002245 [Pleopsidium flavum]|nr:MAG: hypothetical protein M1830_002245 [Pleopsidium flavum]
MAYNAIAQTGHDVLSDTTGSNTSGSPRQLNGENSFGLLSINFESLGGSGSLQAAGTAEHSGTDHLRSLVKSVSSSGMSYDMLSENGYERTEGNEECQGSPPTAQVNWEEEYCKEDAGLVTTAVHSPIPASDSAPSKPVMRTVSREDTVPLRHPTPDLQSPQGSYVGNVARLERSLERLSMTSDIRDELRRNQSEQRRSGSRRSSILGPQGENGMALPSVTRQFSSGSGSSSVAAMNGVARSSGFSPGGHLRSPRGSIRSGSGSHTSSRVRSASRGFRLTQVSEPEQEESSLRSSNPGPFEAIIALPKPPTSRLVVRNGDETPIAKPLQLEQLSQSPPPDYMNDVGLQIRQDMPDRPATAASTDTYQQATDLFVDFDGVHFTPHSQEPLSTDLQAIANRRVSLGRLPLAGRPQSFAEPRPGENMVYYPAPVPMMLNLPQRLSKLPSATGREKRRSQVLSGVMMEAPASATRLPGVLNDGDNVGVDSFDQSPPQIKSIDFRQSANNLADLPPQLRASAFFDQPSTRQEVEVKEDSAVATLESILDASANAPVSAFIDHPIAGRMGAEVYGKIALKRSTGNVIYDKAEARKSRTSMILLEDSVDYLDSGADVKKPGGIAGVEARSDRRKSTAQHVEESEQEAAAYSGEATLFRQSYEPGYLAEAEDIDEETEEFHNAEEGVEVEENRRGQEEEEVGADNAEYIGRPTTLLAELQLRKRQQKLRNRTAATAFPNGMHSTLLELDAVAQVQKQSRKQKHVTLAWEDPDTHYPGTENQDDEDIPLAMLFPGRKALANEQTGRFDEDRPMGLMEKREMEDNEPLSHRRARLTGVLQDSRDCSPAKRNSTKYNLEVPGLTDTEISKNVDEDGETLAQRMKRLKAQGRTATGLQSRPISGDFTSDVLSQLGGPLETDKKGVKENAADMEEETLGQRRKRLHAEQEVRSWEVSGGNRPTVSLARPPISKRRSMADILRAHPAAGARQAPSERLPVSNLRGRSGEIGPMDGLVYHNQHIPIQPYQQFVEPNVLSSDTNQPRPKLTARNRTVLGNPYYAGAGVMAGGIGIPAYNSYCSGLGSMRTGLGGYEGLLTYNNTMDMNGFGCTLPYGGGIAQGAMPMLQIGHLPIAWDQKQRDMIDRWRQSVMH